jgi:hypothetical protein
MEIELNGLPHLVKDRQIVHELVDESGLKSDLNHD